MVRPLRVVSSTVLVTQEAVLCVGHEPLLGLLEEPFVFGGGHHLLSFLGEEQSQVLAFGFVHAFVVDLRQCVQFFPQLLIFMTFLLITQWRQSLKVDILRMEREDTDTAIRVAVGPGMGDGGIIDRQDLQHTLFGSRHPVDHLHQVTEVADTEALFAPQGEHRY